MSENRAEDSGRGPVVVFSHPQVNLYTFDIETSLRFYSDVLGFAETFRFPRAGAPMHIELQSGNFKLGLATFAALEHDHGIRTARGPPQVEIALFTNDPDGAYGWATSHGAPSVIAPHDFGGYIRSARVADPDGNPVVFTTKLPVNTDPSLHARPSFNGHLYNIYVRKIEDALGFYGNILGFSETFRVPKLGAPTHVELQLDSVYLAISTLDALKQDHGLTGGGGPPRGEVVLWTEDADTAFSWITTQGVRSLSPPHSFGGSLRAGWVADPDGNPVQIVSRSHRGS